MASAWTVRPRADQRMYLMKMLEELGSTNESAALRELIDLGIARREEAAELDTLLRVAAQQLTLLKRMAHGIDPNLLQQAKDDAEALFKNLKKEKLT